MSIPAIRNSVGMAVSAVADSGVGTITLGTALSGGYQTAATAYGADANIDIRIEEGDTWEVCRDCTYTHSGTTVSRGTLEDGSSGTGTRVAFTVAAKVYVVQPASRIAGGEMFRALGTAGQSVPSVAITKITTMGTPTVNEVGTVSSGTVTVTLPGTYVITGTVAVAESPIPLIAFIGINGPPSGQDIWARSTGVGESGCVRVARLAVGDTVAVYGYVGGAATTAASRPLLQMVRIAA